MIFVRNIDLIYGGFADLEEILSKEEVLKHFPFGNTKNFGGSIHTPLCGGSEMKKSWRLIIRE